MALGIVADLVDSRKGLIWDKADLVHILGLPILVELDQQFNEAIDCNDCLTKIQIHLNIARSCDHLIVGLEIGKCNRKELELLNQQCKLLNSKPEGLF